VTPSIRPAVRGDAARVHEIATAAWHDAHEPIIGRDAVREFLDRYYTPADLREAIEKPETVFLVVGDPIAGFVEVGPSGDEDGTWTVYRIYVHPDEYGDGIGTRLLSAAESRVDAERLRLVVMGDNDRAVGFYESRGFERVDTAESEWGTTDFVYEKPLEDTA